MSEFEFFDENSETNGKHYVDEIDFEIPNRIKNILINENFSSEIAFFKRLEELTIGHTSYYLFPGNLMSFYPNFVEHKATKPFTCYLSGAPIKVNEKYYCYRPLIENLETTKVYTITKSVISSLGYLDLFPTTLLEFEIWCQKLDQNDYSKEDKIDFYSFATIAGSNALYLKELKKNPMKRKQRERIKKIKELKNLEQQLIKLIPTAINPEQVEIKLEDVKRKINHLENHL